MPGHFFATGNAGNNLLDGGAGADLMIGGAARTKLSHPAMARRFTRPTSYLLRLDNRTDRPGFHWGRNRREFGAPTALGEESRAAPRPWTFLKVAQHGVLETFSTLDAFHRPRTQCDVYP